MDETERTIFELIKNSSDPEAALQVALKLALDLLTSPVESRCKAPSSHQA